MKKKLKKLTLNKSTVSNLEPKAQNEIIGGISHRGCHTPHNTGEEPTPTCSNSPENCSISCGWTCGC